jgi:hypothetical protein
MTQALYAHINNKRKKKSYWDSTAIRTQQIQAERHLRWLSSSHKNWTEKRKRTCFSWQLLDFNLQSDFFFSYAAGIWIMAAHMLSKGATLPQVWFVCKFERVNLAFFSWQNKTIFRDWQKVISRGYYKTLVILPTPVNGRIVYVLNFYLLISFYWCWQAIFSLIFRSFQFKKINALCINSSQTSPPNPFLIPPWA